MITIEDIKKMDNRTFTYYYLLALHRKLTREEKKEKQMNCKRVEE